MKADAQGFTITELAKMFGKTRQAMHRALSGSPPSGKKIVGNNVADTWRFEDVPADLQAEWIKIQEREYCRTPEAVAADPPSVWPPLPLSSYCDDDVQNASRLERAMTRSLALPREISIAERARVFAEDYEIEFKRQVSQGHARFLITRTFTRRGGREKFEPADFLPDKPRLRASVPVSTRAVAVDGTSRFELLAGVLKDFRDRAELKLSERLYCWRSIVTCFQSGCNEGAERTILRRKLCAFVRAAVPMLALSDAAFSRNLDRYLRTASAPEGIAAIHCKSGRPRKEEAERIPDFEINVELLKEWTKKRNGSVSQAYRELHTGKTPDGRRFTEAFREYFPFRAKSRVPKIMRRAARQHFALAKRKIIGGNFQRSARPHFQQDWSKVHSNEGHTADDITADVYTYQMRPDGTHECARGRFSYGRPQIIAVICDRVSLPLTVVSEQVKHPTGDQVWTAFVNTWRNPEIGIPRYVKVERGVFDALKVRELFAWPTIDEKLTQEGITFDVIQANGPEGKSAIERWAEKMHRQMTHLPGYCGNDERVTCPAHLRRFLDSFKEVGQPRKVEVDPAEMLMSKEEFDRELKRVCDAMADEQEEGMRLRGMSPRQAWTAFSSERPAQVLPLSLEYLLTHRRVYRKVGFDGIIIPHGKWDKRTYFGSARLGSLIGERVEVYYNPDIPDHIICIDRASDPRGIDPFSVPLFVPMPANVASEEQRKRSNEQLREFMAPSRAVTITFTPPSSLTVRNERLASPDTHERGHAIKRVEAEHVAAKPRRDAYVLEKRRENNRLRAEILSEEAEAEETTTP